MPIIADLRINGESIYFVEIVNDGTGTKQRGNYNIRLLRGPRSRPIGEHPFSGGESARVEFYDRSLGALELLRQALNALDEEHPTTDGVKGAEA